MIMEEGSLQIRFMFETVTNDYVKKFKKISNSVPLSISILFALTAAHTKIMWNDMHNK